MKKLRVSAYQTARPNKCDSNIKTYVKSKIYSDIDLGPFTEIEMPDDLFDVLVSPNDMCKIRVYNSDFSNYYDTFVITRKSIPKIQDACETQIVYLMTSQDTFDASQFDTACEYIISIAALRNLLPLVYKSRGCFFLEVISSD